MITETRVCNGAFSRWMQRRAWGAVTLPLPWKVLVLYWGPPTLRTVSHEWVHVQQAIRWGWFGFWWRYLWGLRLGYDRHPMELEAYERETG